MEPVIFPSQKSSGLECVSITIDGIDDRVQGSKWQLWKPASLRSQILQKLFGASSIRKLIIFGQRGLDQELGIGFPAE